VDEREQRTDCGIELEAVEVSTAALLT